MNTQVTGLRVQRLRWQVLGFTSLLITFFVTFFYLFRHISLIDSILGWIVANLIAWGVILFSFQRIEFFQTQLNQKFTALEIKAHRDAVMAQLSGSLASSLDETEVCQELVNHLRSIQGYDHVGVFTIESETQNRILKAEYNKENLKSRPILKPGEGLSEQPILDGKLHYSPDIRQEPKHVPGLSSGSEVDVPIHYDGEVMGVICIESQEINAFRNEDFEMLSLAADQAALALKNARLLDAEKTRRKHAEILQRATTTLTSALEIDKVLAEILDQLRQVINHDSACIFICEEDTVHAIAARGLPKMDEVVGKRFPATDQLFQLVLAERRPIIIDSVENDPRFQGWGGTNQMQSWMGIPLIARDNVVGLLTLDSNDPKAYKETHINLAKIFANQAAIAIENAQLFQTTKDSSDRQEVLHQMTQEIIRTGMNLDQIYRAVHQATAQLMPADSFVISILNEKRKEIEAVYLWDLNKRHESRILPMGTGLSWYVIETGKTVLAYDYYNQEELKAVNVVHFGSQDHVRSVLAVPMRLSDKVIGMLSAQSYQSHHYTNEDQKILDMLAAYAAIAIDNARLFSEVQRLAITDSLTDVFNRRYFFDIAHQEILRARRYEHPISIIMLDLDYYKEINDAFGHDIGDKALKLIAQTCKDNVRKTDVLARYGGDEFIVLLPETDISECTEIAERLRIHLETHPIIVGTYSMHTTISVGISGADTQIPELYGLLKCADIALYEAKEAGRNCVKIQAYIKSSEANHD